MPAIAGEALASLRALVVILVLCCGLYPLAVYGLGQLLFPWKANGSLIDKDGNRATPDNAVRVEAPRTDVHEPALLSPPPVGGRLRIRRGELERHEPRAHQRQAPERRGRRSEHEGRRRVVRRRQAARPGLPRRERARGRRARAGGRRDALGQRPGPAHQSAQRGASGWRGSPRLAASPRIRSARSSRRTRTGATWASSARTGVNVTMLNIALDHARSAADRTGRVGRPRAMSEQVEGAPGHGRHPARARDRHRELQAAAGRPRTTRTSTRGSAPRPGIGCSGPRAASSTTGGSSSCSMAAVKPGMAVADVGAGTGLFTMMLSDAVGPQGRVYAEEVIDRFSRYLAERAVREGRANVVSVVGTERSVGLPPASIDLGLPLRRLPPLRVSRGDAGLDPHRASQRRAGLSRRVPARARAEPGLGVRACAGRRVDRPPRIRRRRVRCDSRRTTGFATATYGRSDRASRDELPEAARPATAEARDAL